MNKPYSNNTMKNTYRIKQYITDAGHDGKILSYYIIEILTFKFFFLETWDEITNFEPISKYHTFSSIEEAKSTLEKYIEYQKQLSMDNTVVDKFER